MKDETKIVNFDGRNDSLQDIKRQAATCIQGYSTLKDLKTDLSKQIFEDAPALYFNPTEKIIMSELVSGSEPIATVLSSGDFAIDAAMHGARDILTFDINRNQYYPAALKLKMLQNFSYEELWGFFSDVNSKKWLSPKIYEQLKKQAENDPKLYAFFDEFMVRKVKETKNRESLINSLPFFMSPVLKDMNEVAQDDILSQMLPSLYKTSDIFRTVSGLAGKKDKNTYLENEQSYKKAQEAIKQTNISFIKADLNRLRSILERTKNFENMRFHSIYLSNIPEYINGEVFAKTVEQQLDPLLSTGGKIAYCCQSISAKHFDLGIDRINKLKSEVAVASPMYQNLLPVRLLNVVEGTNLLKEKYKVDLMEVPMFGGTEGFSNVDTYVRIKRR